MNTETFTAEQIRQGVRAYTERPKHSLHKLARESGVDWASLKRFAFEGKGLNIDSVEKLWPFLHPDAPTTPPQDAA